MVKEYQERSIAIKKDYEAGMKAIEIARLFSISPQKVNYWIHHPITYKKEKGKIDWGWKKFNRKMGQKQAD